MNLAVMASVEVQAWYAAAGAQSLAQMRTAYRPERGLFDRQLKDRAWTATSPAEAVTSSAACMIALRRAGVPPSDLGVDTDRCLSALARALREQRHTGALGLAIWANAVSGGIPFDLFLGMCGCRAGELSGMPARFTTMELAWLLAGTLHERLRTESQALTELIAIATTALLRRQAPSGLFLHCERGAPAWTRLRRHVATFADQIYAIQALAFMVLAEAPPAAFDAARRCARAVAELQGDRGQWWWHYSPQRGSVSRRYPVYSVHQYGMAPMALMAMSRAGCCDRIERAWSGLRWLDDNELGIQMLDTDARTVWRDIELSEPKRRKLLRDCAEVAGLAGDDSVHPPLRVNYETRPYEWAWCVMAGAQVRSLPGPGHLA